MHLALTILLCVAALGVLIRGYFSPIMPFDVLKQGLRLLPRMIRRKWPVVLMVCFVVMLAPLATITIRAARLPPLGGFALNLAWQALTVACLSLAAIRFHRALVLREGGSGLRFGGLEARIVGYVVAAWACQAAVTLVPLLVARADLNLMTRISASLAPLAAWGILVALAYLGAAVSLGSPTPLRSALNSARGALSGTATIVLICQACNGLSALGLAAVVELTGRSMSLVVAGSLLSVALSVAVFVVSELALAIAFTRINNGVYDDTPSRDYNADWV